MKSFRHEFHELIRIQFVKIRVISVNSDKRRRRDIFVEMISRNFTSSVGAKSEYAAPDGT
jgi:hypothetical protein